MISNPLCLIVIVCLLLPLNAFAESENYITAIKAGARPRAGALTVAERIDWENAASAMTDENTFNQSDRAYQLLVDFGETGSIDTVLSYGRGSEGTSSDRIAAWRIFERSRNPDLLIRLKNDVFTEETIEYIFEGEFMMDPISVSASVAVLKIIASNAEFSDELRVWAKELRRANDREKLREDVRSFYRENLEYLESKAYSTLNQPHTDQ